jgi:hypothetical protein
MENQTLSSNDLSDSFGDDGFEDKESNKTQNSKIENQIGFNTKLKFNAIKLLSFRRDELMRVLKSNDDRDRHVSSTVSVCPSSVWELKPVDFSRKEYEPNPVVKKREVAILKHELVRAAFKERAKKNDAPNLYLKNFMEARSAPVQRIQMKKHDSNSVNYFQKRSLLMESFENHREYDFRQYVSPSLLGLPQFVQYATGKALNKDAQDELLKLYREYFVDFFLNYNIYVQSNNH